MSPSRSLGALFRLTLASGVSAAVALHLKRGAPIDGRDGKGRTPLILAAGRGHAEVCRLLIEAGADPELQDNDGQDALAVARAGRHSHIVALLAGVTVPAIGEEDAVALGCASPADGPAPLEDHSAAAPPNVAEAPADTAGNRDLPTAATRILEVEAEPALASNPSGEPAVADDAEQPGSSWIAEEEAASASPTIYPVAGDGATTRSAPDAALAAPSRQDDPAPSLEEPADPLWEPEPEPVLSLSEVGVEQTASALDAGLTKHTAQLSDPDWLDTEIVLPDVAPSWAAALVDPHEGYLAVISLLETGVREGWLPDEEIAALGTWAVTPKMGEVLTDAVRMVLGDIGMIIEAEHALELSREARAPLDPDEPAARSSDIVDAIDFIGGLSGGFLDAESMLLDAAKRASVLSAREEASLFRELASSLGAMLQLAASSPSTVPILIRWAEQLEAGVLLPKDVSETERGTSPSDPEESRRGTDESEEVDTSDDGEEGVSDADVLASRLREVAGKLMGSAQDARPALIGLSLASRRVLELAEGMLSLDGRQPPRRCLTTRGTAGASDLRLLRRRPSDKAGAPAQDIASTRDRYLAAQETIVEANLRRVVWFARRYARGTDSFLDLVQEGQIGLLRAIDRYDFGRGWRFGTYATWWIRQSISRYVQDTSRTVRIPVHLLECIAKMRRHADAFRVRHGFEPSPLDLAQAAELDVRTVERALAADREIVQLEGDMGLSAAEDDDPGSLRSFLPPELVDPATPLATILQTDLRLAILDALQKLGRREARILDLRFGITGDHPLTLEEVGQSYRVTRERIRQIEAKALRRVRRHLPSRHFENMAP
ncbi:MAG: sigma-70 family RNA polymerase sigma factor [Geminicoccaceae bacterium]